MFSVYEDRYEDSPIETEFERLNFGCECGNTKWEISCDGLAYPCIAFEDTPFRDDITKYENLSECWHSSDVLKKFRELKYLAPSLCSECKFVDFCNGGCPFFNLNEFGKMENSKDPRCPIKNSEVQA